MKGFFSSVLVTVGAVVASFGIAQTNPEVEGWIGSYQVNNGLTIAGIVALAVGIVIRRSGAKEAAQAQIDSGTLGAAKAALSGSVDSVKKLADALDGIASHDELHERIDAVVTGPLTDFSDNCRTLIDTHGMAVYATVVGPFSQGERFLNRAWSASADGYLEEARDSIRKAVGPLTEAYQGFPAG